MPKAFPREFREDVIRVYRDSDSSVAQVAKDFGVSPSCLKRWLTIDDRKSTSLSPAAAVLAAASMASASPRSSVASAADLLSIGAAPTGHPYAHQEVESGSNVPAAVLAAENSGQEMRGESAEA